MWTRLPCKRVLCILGSILPTLCCPLDSTYPRIAICYKQCSALQTLPHAACTSQCVLSFSACLAGTLAALVTIAQKEGMGALYAGVWLTWLKQAPQYAVTFLCYDLAKAWLAAENGNGKHHEEAQPNAASAQRPHAPFSLPAHR